MTYDITYTISNIINAKKRIYFIAAYMMQHIAARRTVNHKFKEKIHCTELCFFNKYTFLMISDLYILYTTSSTNNFHVYLA